MTVATNRESCRYEQWTAISNIAASLIIENPPSSRLLRLTPPPFIEHCQWWFTAGAAVDGFALSFPKRPSISDNSLFESLLILLYYITMRPSLRVMAALVARAPLAAARRVNSVPALPRLHPALTYNIIGSFISISFT